MTAYANSSLRPQSAIMLDKIESSPEKTDVHRPVNDLGNRRCPRAGEKLLELIELARRSAPTVLVIALRIFR
jgi:hypothetical protein